MERTWDFILGFGVASATRDLGEQVWCGIAASLGFTALAALKNPSYMPERLDDLAQYLENLQLDDEVRKVTEEVVKAVRASLELSDKLGSPVFEYCGVAISIGELDCIACGVPLEYVQPSSCPHRGFVVHVDTTVCANCNKKIK